MPGAAMYDTSSNSFGEHRGLVRSRGVFHKPACFRETDRMYTKFARPAAILDIFFAPSPLYLDISRHFAGRSA